MPVRTKRQSSSSSQPETFQDHLRRALEQFHDAQWLGEHSPLSAPYFLGSDQRPSPAGFGSIQRGETLQRLLRQAADWLATQGEDAHESFDVVRQSYFQRPALTAEEVGRRLNMSRATYFRRREQAIQHLSAAFIRQINPALRLDRPSHPEQIIGRDELRQACLHALQSGRTVGLSGPAGVGKTTIGASLIDQMTARHTFWFTFIPGLNDHLGSVLFALGYFLWQQGAANLWGQLAADQGRINPTILTRLLHADLDALHPARPVLCFDEVDLLRPDEAESHALIVAFLGSLRGSCGCLFIGQRPLIEVDEQFALDGLSAPDVQQYLELAGITLTAEDRQHLIALTAGNPRLIGLLMSLHHSGESITAVLQRLQTAPSVEFLLNRIRQHLDLATQDLLDDLSVFRRSAPADAWSRDIQTTLVDRRLAAYDAHGGIALLPTLRAVIVDRLRPDIRRQSHLKAANIRAARAEHTAAAYHLVRAGEAGRAVSLWYGHRTEEINQGQGSAALALFEQVDQGELVGAQRDEWALAVAELRRLAGQDPRANLREANWHSPVYKAQAKRLEGDVAELLGHIDDAIKSYQDGLATVENLLAEKTLFEKNLGWVYMRQGGASLDLAWQKACLARFEAERLQGDIQSRLGGFAQAEVHYTQALALAESFNHVEGKAKTHNHLATLLTRQCRLDEAGDHRQQAITLFQQMGNQVHLAGAKLNMAFHYNLVGQQQAVMPPAEASLAGVFELAVQVATEALILFKQLGQMQGQVIALQNLAEAQLFLGHLAEAGQSAQRVIDSQAPAVLPDGLRTLGEVRLMQGNAAAAEELIRQSITLAKQNADRYLEAYGWRALAHTLCIDNRQNEGQLACDEAIVLFESLELPQEVERCRAMWARLAASLPKRQVSPQ